MLEQWNVDGVMQKQLNKDTIAVTVTIWVGWGGNWTPDIFVGNIKMCQTSYKLLFLAASEENN